MTKPSSAEDVLSELYHAGAPYLQPLQWEFESDRWSELLICALLVSLEIGPEVARPAVATLRHLDLLSPSTLAASSAEDQMLVVRVLVQHGVTPETSSKAAKLLSQIAQLTMSHWGGHIQRFLREYGVKMVKELASFLELSGMKGSAAK